MARNRSARIGRQNSARSEAGRPAGRAANQVRSGHQFDDSQSAWSDDPRCISRTRRRGDRITPLFVAADSRPVMAHLRRRTMSELSPQLHQPRTQVGHRLRRRCAKLRRDLRAGPCAPDPAVIGSPKAISTSRRPHRDYSVSHEDWQRRIGQDVAGCSPKDQLPQATLCVGSFDQEIAILRGSRCQNRLTGRATV